VANQAAVRRGGCCSTLQPRCWTREAELTRLRCYRLVVHAIDGLRQTVISLADCGFFGWPFHSKPSNGNECFFLHCMLIQWPYRITLTVSIPAGLFLYHRRTLVRLSGLYLAGTNIPDANHQMRRHGRRGSSSDRLCLKSENSKLINSKLTRV
jgi:hypothetical protein